MSTECKQVLFTRPILISPTHSLASWLARPQHSFDEVEYFNTLLCDKIILMYASSYKGVLHFLFMQFICSKCDFCRFHVSVCSYNMITKNRNTVLFIAVLKDMFVHSFVFQHLVTG